MSKLFFATKNKDKILKMKNRLLELDIELLTPYDVDVEIDIDENGKDVIENATLKAKAYYDKLNIPTIATDSSLYVDKFDVQPGLFVRRVDGVTLNDDELEEHYVRKLDVIGGSSNAHYITGLALVQDGRKDEITIQEDDFLFTSNLCSENRNFDPLSRLEYDEKSNKYFCQLTAYEMTNRNYKFDLEVRKFVESNLKL